MNSEDKSLCVRLQTKINKLRYDKEVLKNELSGFKNKYFIADKRLRMCQRATDYRMFNDTININLTCNGRMEKHNVPIYIEEKSFVTDLDITVDKFPVFIEEEQLWEE